MQLKIVMIHKISHTKLDIIANLFGFKQLVPNSQ